MNQPTPDCPLIITVVGSLGMAICPDNSDIFVEFRYPTVLTGVSTTSLCPALISPRPSIMMGVILIMVMIMMEVNTNRHIVQTDKQLSKELLLMLTVQNLFLIIFLNLITIDSNNDML